jgi:hypothetical protein
MIRPFFIGAENYFSGTAALAQGTVRFKRGGVLKIARLLPAPLKCSIASGALL